MLTSSAGKIPLAVVGDDECRLKGRVVEPEQRVRVMVVQVVPLAHLEVCPQPFTAELKGPKPLNVILYLSWAFK